MTPNRSHPTILLIFGKSFSTNEAPTENPLSILHKLCQTKLANHQEVQILNLNYLTTEKAILTTPIND